MKVAILNKNNNTKNEVFTIYRKRNDKIEPSILMGFFSWTERVAKINENQQSFRVTHPIIS